jgi:hypothetical protein
LFLTLRKEHSLRMFEKSVLRRIFGSKRDEVVKEWRKLQNEELPNLYSSPSIIRMIKSMRMRLAGHVARAGAKRNSYRILDEKPEGKKPLGRPRYRWEDIVTDLLSALLSNGSVNKSQQRDCFYVVRDATVATQRRSKQTHLCGNWSTRNNEKCVRSFLCSRRRGYITRHWWDARQSTTIQVSDCPFWGLNKIRHRLLHNPALTDVNVYIRTKCQVIFCL